MFNKITVTLALAIIGLVVGGAFALTGGDAQAEPVLFQTANMRLHSSQTEDGSTPMVPGAATLTRSPEGISYGIYTTGLGPGNAHTIWTVIFNRPQNCVNGCGGDDLSNASVRASIVYGGSYITGENGTANFLGSVEKGFPPSGIQLNVPLGTANGLTSPVNAEIHLVLRTHGEPIAGDADVQLSTFEDGAACINVDGNGDPVCANVQFAVFPAP